jgi:ATP-dependent Clp protease adaptor protein ClpS
VFSGAPVRGLSRTSEGKPGLYVAVLISPMSATSKQVHLAAHEGSRRIGQADVPGQLADVPGGVSATTPVLTPAEKRTEFEQHSPLYHVVLLDDDEHTYDYVVEMLQKLFLMPTDVAFQHAVEVDTTGRTIVITCELPQAEFARDQVHAYGADPRMPKSKGSMTAVLMPASNTKEA